MARVGLLGSIAASVTVAAGVEWLSLSEWSFTQKRSFYEAYDIKGFPLFFAQNSPTFLATKLALSDLKSAGLLKKTVSDEKFSRQLFASCTRDAQSLSSFGMKSWSVGYPLFFHNTTQENVNRHAVRLRHSFTYLWTRRKRLDDAAHTFERKPLTETQWNSEAGQELLLSLVVPNKDALKFVAARQLIGVSRYGMDSHIQAGILSLFPVSIYGLANLWKSALKQPATRGLSVIIYSLSTLLISAGIVTVLDFHHCSAERSVDTKAAKLSVNYAKGGADYYNQLLSQNRALRQLQADANDWKAAQTVSPIGDPITFIRQKSLPLSTRRDICVSIFDEQSLTTKK